MEKKKTHRLFDGGMRVMLASGLVYKKYVFPTELNTTAQHSEAYGRWSGCSVWGFESENRLVMIYVHLNDYYVYSSYK